MSEDWRKQAKTIKEIIEEENQPVKLWVNPPPAPKTYVLVEVVEKALEEKDAETELWKKDRKLNIDIMNKNHAELEALKKRVEVAQGILKQFSEKLGDFDRWFDHVEEIIVYVEGACKALTFVAEQSKEATT